MKNVVIVTVAAAAIIGFAYFALLATPANDLANEAESTMNELSMDPAATPVVPEPRQGKGSLEYLRSLNENMECTISYTETEQQGKVEGTYFVSEGSMRGDFLTQSPDLSGQILSSMIIDNGVMYIWSEIEGDQYGIKVDLSTAGGADVQSREPVSMNDDVDYNCKPWRSVDRTVFVPPVTVLFQDMDQLIKGGMEYGNLYEAGDFVPEMIQ